MQARGSEAGSDLVVRTLAAMAPELRRRARERRRVRRRIGVRLALVGLAALPAIVIVHGGTAWLGHEILTRLAGVTVANAFLYLSAATMCLGLALSYGALPLLADWGAAMRSRLAPDAERGASHSPDWSPV